MTVIGKNFPLTREARKAQLKTIVKDNQVIGTVKVPGHGRVNVYKIPLEYLSYNPYNTRFLAQAKTLEKRLGRTLSDENAEDIFEIENFLWKLKEDKNANTIDSLIKEGQLQPGVVTNDGIVLSGNRRFRLLNEISRNHSKYKDHSLEGLQFFEAAILTEKLTDKEIRAYESFYQYGNEDKVEYDPIQKYIAAYEQSELGFELQDIANHFLSITAGDVKVVKKWLKVFELMTEYLEYIGEDGIYTALTNREEAFLNLYETEKSLRTGKKGKSIWAFDELDLVDLKQRYFDYIRLGKATHDFRYLIKVFSEKKRWDAFNKNVNGTVAATETKTLDDYRQEHTELNESEISTIRQNDYVAAVGKTLDKLFGEEKAYIVNKEQEVTPIKALDSILDKFSSLKTQLDSRTNVDTFVSGEFTTKFETAKKAVFDLEKTLKRLK